jgi:hypothetical protein
MKVVDRVALFEELGVGDHVELEAEVALAQFPLDDGFDAVGRADRHGRLVDDDLVVADDPADLAWATWST